MSKSTYFRLLLATASGLVWFSQADAQTSNQPETGPATAAAGQAQAGVAPASQVAGVSEIVVTAQRREERLQDVPVNVAAFNSAAITTHAITDAVDLQRLTPGLVINKSIGAAVPWLRGVGSISSGFGTEMPVATYVDGFYLPTPAAGVFSLNNVERVEVLKGPQGTLFGRNASAGVIQVITKDPSPSATVDASVGYANYDTRSADFYGSTALTDELAGSLALTGSDQGQGWGKNLFTGSDAFKTVEYGGQAKLQWKHGGTRVTLEQFYDNHQSDVGIEYGVVPGELGADGTPFLGDYNISNRQDRVGHAIQALTGLKVEQETPIGTLVSLSGYNQIHSIFSFDQNGVPGIAVPGRSAVDVELDGRAHTFTQELQLLSANTGPLQWILGAFYLDDHQGLNQVVHGICVGGVCAPPVPVLVQARQAGSSYAVFGQATYEIFPRTHLTVGLRYTDDMKSIAGSSAVPAPGYPNTPATLPASSLASPGLPFPGFPNGIPTSASWNKLTWRFSLDYKLTDNVMVYASDNRGFKSGTFNITSFTNPPAAPETLDAYEVGLKSTLLDNTLRLDGSAFYYDYQNIQLRTTTGAAAGQTILSNAAKSNIYGLDVDAVYVPTARLTFSAAIELLDAHYTSFPGATCNVYSTNTSVTPNVGVISTYACDDSGHTMIRSPKFTGNFGVNYRWTTSVGDVVADLSDTYTSSFFWDPNNRISQNPYHYLTASLTWTSLSGRYDVQLWGKNLSNSFYYTAAFEASGGSDTYSPGDPRTFGVRLRVHL